MAMRPRPTHMMTPGTIPRVAKAEGTEREPRAMASTIRQMVSRCQLSRLNLSSPSARVTTAPSWFSGSIFSASFAMLLPLASSLNGFSPR